MANIRYFISILCALLLNVHLGRASATIGVHFHVFYDQNNPSDGNIPDAVLTQQTHVLNTFFTQMGLNFAQQSVQRHAVSYNTVHNWNPDNKKPLSNHRQGGAASLNVYIAGANSAVPSGFVSCSPSSYHSDPQNDGIVIDYNSLPGGANAHHNTGKMLVTAVGYWCGLYATSQGGCSEPGDYVDDTPAEASPAFGCPTGRDTCPGAGVDPIHNLMDSTYDSCRTSFTTGQYNRIGQALAAYRGVTV